MLWGRYESLQLSPFAHNFLFPSGPRRFLFCFVFNSEPGRTVCARAAAVWHRRPPPSGSRVDLDSSGFHFTKNRKKPTASLKCLTPQTAYRLYRHTHAHTHAVILNITHTHSIHKMTQASWQKELIDPLLSYKICPMMRFIVITNTTTVIPSYCLELGHSTFRRHVFLAPSSTQMDVFWRSGSLDTRLHFTPA